MKSSKSRILFVLHTPPPVHGAAVVGQYIKNSNVINETFKCRYINLSTSTQIDKIGKNGIIKFIRYINILLKVIYDLVVYRPDLCYVTLTAKGSAFFKDSLVVFIVKLFRVKPVYHFHNKGITSKQDKFLYNIFYTRIFSRSNVIYFQSICTMMFKNICHPIGCITVPMAFLTTIKTKLNGMNPSYQ
jgi:hypothetical protein